MVDDRPEDNGPLGASSRPRREPPTIDLQATEVSSEPAKAQAGAQAEHAPVEPSPEPVAQPAPQPVSPWAIAPISGAVAAALVIAVGWVLGWPAVQSPTPAPQFSAAIDDLTVRIAGLETKAGKPAADPAAAARIEAVEKSLAPLRGEPAQTRAQAEKLSSVINDVKSAPRDGAAAVLHLFSANQRVAKNESATPPHGPPVEQ